MKVEYKAGQGDVQDGDFLKYDDGVAYCIV